MSLLTDIIDKLREIFPQKDITISAKNITIEFTALTDADLYKISNIESIFESLRITANDDKVILTLKFKT